MIFSGSFQLKPFHDSRIMTCQAKSVVSEDIWMHPGAIKKRKQNTPPQLNRTTTW